MIKDMGNVELFDLCETIPKVQCSECLHHWSRGIVYCPCGHLLRESEANRGEIMKGRPLAIDMGRLKNKETIILPIISKRDASRGILKGFTIVS